LFFAVHKLLGNRVQLSKFVNGIKGCLAGKGAAPAFHQELTTMYIVIKFKVL
jgi:hypothetical protein